jgi:hypothetical protein
MGSGDEEMMCRKIQFGFQVLFLIVQKNLSVYFSG